MRVLNILLILALGVALVNAEEITVNLDRVSLIVPEQEDYLENSSRIAIHFTMREEINGKDIIFAELCIPLNFGEFNIEGDSLLEIGAFDITTDWTEGNTDWDTPWSNPGGDIDTLSSYTYSIMMGQSDDVHMDITRFVRSVVENGRNNYGLMLIPFKYDQPIFHIYEDVDTQIRNSAEVRVTFK
jgi:hypothetical protein